MERKRAERKGEKRFKRRVRIGGGGERGESRRRGGKKKKKGGIDRPGSAAAS